MTFQSISHSADGPCMTSIREILGAIGTFPNTAVLVSHFHRNGMGAVAQYIHEFVRR